jgi:hypothetical protein
MNSRNMPGHAIAAAVLLGSMCSAGTASADADATLVQVFDAVCVNPVDAAGRKAAAHAQGLRTPPQSFQGKRPGGKGATLELNVWKALEGRMLILYTLIEPMPGYENLSSLTCRAILSPGDPAALADAGAALGVPFVADEKGAQSAAFEITPDGRRPLDMSDEAAMGDAMQSGRLSLISFNRSAKSDVDVIQLLRTQAP